MSARHRHAKQLHRYRLWLCDMAASTLAHNLAVAGALCAAFSDGWNVRFLPGQGGSRKPWRPGCGREVPR